MEPWVGPWRPDRARRWQRSCPDASRTSTSHLPSAERMLRLLSCLLVCACAAAGVGAQTVPAAAVPPPAVAAKAYVLLDVLSGQTLVAQNADELREPASLT